MEISLSVMIAILFLLGLPALILGLVVLKGVGGKLDGKGEAYLRAQGRVVLVERTSEGPVRFYVSYEVEGKTYTLAEWAQMEWDSLKLGPLALASEGVWANGFLQEGDDISLLYDPHNPSRAIIEGYDRDLRPDLVSE